MPAFRFAMNFSGADGCMTAAQNAVGDGETLVGCGLQGCHNCIARRAVDFLRSVGVTITNATIVHDPGGLNECTDDLVAQTRTGTLVL